MIVLRMHCTTMLHQGLWGLKTDGAADTLIDLFQATLPLFNGLLLQHFTQHVLNILFGFRGGLSAGLLPTEMPTMLHEAAMTTCLQRCLKLQTTEGAIVARQTMLVLLVALQCHPRTLCSTADVAAKATLIVIRCAPRGRHSCVLCGEMATQL